MKRVSSMPSFIRPEDHKSHKAKLPQLLPYPQSSEHNEISPYILELAEALAFNAREYYACGQSAMARDTVNVGGIGEYQFEERLDTAIRDYINDEEQRFRLLVEMDNHGAKTIAELTLYIR